MLSTTIYDTETLLGVMRDDKAMSPPATYWLDLAYPEVANFTTEYIDFEKISGNRKIAPLVVPTAQGKQIYSQASRVTRVKPAYVKPKDPITASRMIRRAAGLGELAATKPLTPKQRYDATVADIAKTHRYAIERRWEWLAAQATLYGKVTLEGESYPTTVVDFERDAGHDITLVGAATWGSPGVSILENVQTWNDTMRAAAFGGGATRLTVGGEAWKVMRKDPEIKGMLDTTIKQNLNSPLNLGLRQGLDVEYVGNLSGTLPVYVYSDYYQNDAGVQVPFMDPKDVCLTGSNIHGVRCFGAIQDKKAQWNPLAMFPKMWDEEDPSATFFMTQSAPLMVPINPNNTLRARVIAGGGP